jgi:putative aminopeptidase FrvX
VSKKDALPGVDGKYMIEATADLCRIPSPSGYTAEAIAYVERELTKLDVELWRTVKGSLVAKLPAAKDAEKDGRVLSAHVDTLGAMVKEIKGNGRLKLTQIGGYDWSTIEGEYCLVHTAKNVEISGTILTQKASTHVHGRAVTEQKRDEQSIEVRLDENVSSADAAKALGVEVGDYVSFDPRTTITDSGYIKSRHLDDKACVAILLGTAKAIKEAKLKLATPAYLYISVFEEVGHGTSAGLPEGVTEVIAVDMAAVGEGQTSDELATTVCVKNSSGPYDYDLSRRLIDLAKANQIDCRVDIYSYYASDVSQALRAGYDVRGALIGPGVDASHSYERLHQRSLEESAKLLLAYILS